MAEKPGNESSETTTPDVFALVTPRAPRSYDEPLPKEAMAEVRSLLNELRKALGEVAAKVDAQGQSAAETKELLRQLAPKIEDVAGFVKHRVPILADKADLEKMANGLRAEIEKRPTRRQAILDMVWIFTLITGAITFGSRSTR
jgi:hypothetical protein